MKTSQEKIDLLQNAMTTSERENGTEYTHFTDDAPQELKDVFLNEYNVRDIDYQIFSKACDTIVEAYSNNEEGTPFLKEYIQENYNDFASVYNADRLSYLNIWNDDEVSEIFKNYSCDTISTACATWYDEQVQNAITLIIDNYLGV